MFEIIQNWRTKNTLRKQLLGFLNEMDKNLEIFYVLDQRQFITNEFIMEKWEQVKDLDVIKRHEAIKIYGAALSDFNSSYKEFKTYEQWYTSDVQNKNNENAKKLHNLKGALDLKIKTLEAIIIPAGQCLEKELLNLGFITS